MRNRNIDIHIFLNEEEYQHLQEVSRKTKMSKAQVIRYLLLGYKPKEAPPIEHYKIIRELRSIGNNINQLITAARVSKMLNIRELQKHLYELDKIEDEMHELYALEKSD